MKNLNLLVLHTCRRTLPRRTRKMREHAISMRRLASHLQPDLLWH